jgi:hypothetical protein
LSWGAAARAFLPLIGGALFLAAWRGGLPVFAHDWQISPDWAQYRDACAALGNVAARDNFGGPNPYLYVFPLALACRLAALPLPSATWLGLELFALGAINAAGAAALLRALGVRSALGIQLGALCFVASPLFVNELTAGHLLYCYGSAGLAWACAFTLDVADRGTVADICRAAAAWALALVTIQFTFVLLPLGAALLVVGRRRRAVVALLGLVVLLELPTTVVFAFADAAAFLHADRVTVHWQQSLSTSVPNALSGFGYFAGYAERAYGALAAPLLWVRLALVAAGAVVALALRAGRRFWALAAGVAGALMVAGLDGPLEEPLEVVFRTLPQAAVIRELYHFSVLPALAVALSVAMLVDLRRARPAFAACAAVLLAVSAAPFLTGAALREVPRLDEGHIAAWRSAASAIRSLDVPGSVLYVPSLQPLGPSLAESGVDPDAFRIGAHAALAQFQPDPAVAWVYARYRQGDVDTLARAGVAAAVVRPEWRSFHYEKVETALAPLASLCTREPHAFPGAPRVEAFPRRMHAWRSAAPPAEYLGLPAPSLDDNDPRHGWVDGTRWSGCFPALAELPTDTRLTLSGRALLLRPPPGRYVFLAWAPRGALLGGSRLRSIAPSPHFAAVRSDGPVQISGHGGPLAVTGWIADGEEPYWWRSAGDCGRYAILPARVSRYVKLQGALAAPDGTLPLAAEAPGCGAPQIEATPLARSVAALQGLSEGLFLVLVALGAALPWAARLQGHFAATAANR